MKNNGSVSPTPMEPIGVSQTESLSFTTEFSSWRQSEAYEARILVCANSVPCIGR